jgi:DNA-binding CsgD family transcriptional regulator
MKVVSPFSANRVTQVIHDEQFSNLIGDIYDAALDPSLWVPVLEKCVSFVGGCGGALFFKNAAGAGGDTYFDTGITPYFRKLYFEQYVMLDPSTTGHFVAEIEQPVAIEDFISYDEFLETRFYREWAQPQGLVDFVSTVLDKSEANVAMFGVFRHERDGRANDETRWRMGLIAPHIRRAVVIGRLIDLKHTEATSFDILDGLSAAIFLVSGAGFIVHANIAGAAMLSDGNLLRSVGGRLTIEDARVAQAMREGFAAADEGDLALGVKAITLPLISVNGDRYVGHLLPLSSGKRRNAGLGHGAAAALFVRRAALETPLAPEVIAKTFNLTPTELRVLLAIVEVGGVPEVAAALGIAVTTVKSHLGRLFDKTGVTRQAELVKLVAGYSTPLAR